MPKTAKPSRTEYWKEWFASLNPERQAKVRRDNVASAKRFREREQPSERKRKARASRDRHAEQRRADCRNWRALNREKVAAYNKQWGQDHKEEVRALGRSWRLNNKPRRNAQLRKRYREDLKYRIEISLRTRIYTVLSRRLLKGYKSASSLTLVGCTVDSLIDHITKQFQPGMAWDNYGEWHIDHIRPCALFDLTNPDHQRDCFHFTNLQPLWAVDNMRKHAKYSPRALQSTDPSTPANPNTEKQGTGEPKS